MEGFWVCIIIFSMFTIGYFGIYKLVKFMSRNHWAD